MTRLQQPVAAAPAARRAHGLAKLAPSTKNRRSAGWLAAAWCGAPVGIRTPNLLIRSQMLYPLSYGRPVRRRPLARPAGLHENSRPRGGLRIFVGTGPVRVPHTRVIRVIGL